MDDRELARRTLKEGFSLVAVNDSRILLKTRLPGMKGLLQAIQDLGEKLKGSSVADTIVGRAAALLLVYSEVVYVFAVTISQSGSETLEENGVQYDFETQVPVILDRNKGGPCPFEELTKEISNPKEAFEKLASSHGRA